MLGTSSLALVGNPTDAAAAASGEAHKSGGSSGDVGGGGGGGGAIPSGGFSDEDNKGRIEEGERGGGGHRWPRQETLALLQIRSEMGVAFRDASLKGPLWEEVSRKMAEMGYQRSGKKCKEKFENIYKYHKRTKDGRAAKQDGKTYRFFEQLEALEANPSPLSLPPAPRPLAQVPCPHPLAFAATTMVAAPAVATVGAGTGGNATTISIPSTFSHVTVTSGANPISFSPSVNNPLFSAMPPSQPQLQPWQPGTTIPTTTIPPHQGHRLPLFDQNMFSSLPSDYTSSSTSSDEDIGRRHKRKRTMREFFERLMKDVIVKQEELQTKFLETLEKRERDRMIREEAWRVQETARMNRELDLLAQERSMAAAKDAAMMAFLQKMTGQQNPQIPSNTNGPQAQVSLPLLSHNPLPPQPPQSPMPLSISLPPPVAPPPPPMMTVSTHAPAPAPVPAKNVDATKNDNGGENFMGPSSSRWPKTEVEALIRLRTNLDSKYLENGPKGPLWEEISSRMSKLGYNRSSKRCKEKWENINKYFKKVKESNKRRPDDSKTCPYFHQLDALYREKSKPDPSPFNPVPYPDPGKPGSENPMAPPIMARPEQQWPVPPHESAVDEEENESDNMDENENGEDDDEENENGEGYEIVANKQQASSVSVTTPAAENRVSE